MKTPANPSMTQFDALIKKARRQAKAAGLRKSEILKAIAESRRKKK